MAIKSATGSVLASFTQCNPNELYTVEATVVSSYPFAQREAKKTGRAILVQDWRISIGQGQNAEYTKLSCIVDMSRRLYLETLIQRIKPGTRVIFSAIKCIADSYAAERGDPGVSFQFTANSQAEVTQTAFSSDQGFRPVLAQSAQTAAVAPLRRANATLSIPQADEHIRDEDDMPLTAVYQTARTPRTPRR
jgi:hypothetical protein